MTNPYQTPTSNLKHENTTKPTIIKAVYWLVFIAFCMDSLSTIVVTFSTSNAWNHHTDILISLFILAIFMFVFSATLYFFLLYRPLKKRKPNTATWFFITLVLFSFLAFISMLADLDSDFPLWAGNLLITLIYIELGAIFLSILLLMSPTANRYLENKSLD